MGILLGGAFLLKLLVTLWGIDRGFEMGDEGTFLLSLEHPESTPAAFAFYELLVPRDLHVGVVEARLLRLGVELLASLALVGGLFAWARRRLPGGGGIRFAALLLFSLQGALITVGSRSFSYNDMTNLCLYAATGALLYLASLPGGPEVRGRRAAAACVTGFLGGFQLFVKFPPSLLILAASGAMLAFALPSLARRERLRLLALEGAGVLAALLLLALHDGGPGGLLARIDASAEVAPLAEYDPLAILVRYVVAEAYLYPNLLLMAGAFVAGRRALRGRAPGAAVSAGCAVATACLAASAWLVHPTFLHPSLLALSAFLLFAIVLCAIRMGRGDAPADPADPAAPEPAPAPRAAARLFPLAPLMLPAVLPLIAVMGTNVPFSMRLPSHALPPFAALGALALALRHRRGCRGLFGVLAVAGVALTSVLFVHHHLRAPYGLPHPLRAQTQEVEGLPGVRVHPSTARFLEQTAERLREAGFRPGDPIVAFDYMPGLVFYLGGRSPGWTFYLPERPELNCFNLNRSGLERTPYVVLGRPMPPEQQRCLEIFDFPGDLQLVDTIPFPYEEVYVGFDLPRMSYVSLYAPRKDPARDGAR